MTKYQNDFVKPGGAQHEAVRGVWRAREFHQIASSSRSRPASWDRPSCYPITFSEGYMEVPEQAYGILKGIVSAGAFRQGTWGAEIIDELKPQAGDIVSEDKRGLDCFYTTNLDFILRARGVKNVALAGFLNNVCVESTMRSAYERGFNVITIIDCTATLSEEEQRVATTQDFNLFSHPMMHKAFLDRLAEG